MIRYDKTNMTQYAIITLMTVGTIDRISVYSLPVKSCTDVPKNNRTEQYNYCEKISNPYKRSGNEP